jgi:NRAMP (natural resistance-associated macrophage protein)-like metal ion transporter
MPASLPLPRSLWKRIALFLAVMGPGIITANVDNDAGGLTTYSQAGANFGLRTLWIMIPVTLLLVLVQEMVNRMGVVTGRGLSDMIRERFGVKITFTLMLLVLITNFGNVMAEFAGIAAAGMIFGLPPLATVPLCALFVWLLVTRGNYKSVEKVFLVACVFYVAYPLTVLVIAPPAREVLPAFVTPSLSLSSAYIVTLIGIIGTTIAPWMQFYQQASVAEKNIAVNDYSLSRLDTVVGGFVVSIVASCIVIACAFTLNAQGVRIETAADAARALGPLAGAASSWLFAFGLFNASLFAASILPLSTSYTLCEAFGWESGVNKDFRTAPHFYILYTALIALGALTALVPGMPLVKVMFWSQVLNGILLPVILFFILLLVNDRREMGGMVNGRIYNFICWAATICLVLISLGYLVSMLAGL